MILTAKSRQSISPTEPARWLTYGMPQQPYFGFDRLLGLFLCSDKEDALPLFDDALTAPYASMMHAEVFCKSMM